MNDGDDNGVQKWERWLMMHDDSWYVINNNDHRQGQCMVIRMMMMTSFKTLGAIATNIILSPLYLSLLKIANLVVNIF